MNAVLSLHEVEIVLGGRRAAGPISAAIASGEMVALLGPNGAGKTSLLRAACGLVAVTSGAVALGGADPRSLSARERALRAAYLPQRPQAIWPVRVDELVALGRFAYGAAPDRLSAADSAAIDAALDACGLASLRARRMDELSGGEKGRVHLARALAQHAPLLLLDEPSAGLDPAQALAVGEILGARARAGAAVLFATHDIALAAASAGRVLLMREGRLVAAGRPGDALTPEALTHAYGRAGRLAQVDGVWLAAFSPAQSR